MTSATHPSDSTAGKTGSRRAIRVAAGGLLFVLLLIAGILPRIGRNREAVAIAKAAETSAPSVLVTKVKTVSGNAELLLPGNTEAVNVASIYARANGYVKERMVDIGSRVKAGQTLAVIESPEVDQELAQARASLEQAKAAREQANANLVQARAGVNHAQANVAQAKANEEIAATTDQRWSRLVERGVLPRQSGDERRSAHLARKAESEAAVAALRTAEANVVSRTADLGAAGANVDAQSANVRRLQQVQGFQRVLAPFDGVVTERKVERGDLVTAGSSGARNLFTVAQAKTLRIQANVPQSYAVDLRTGQTAEILVRERPGRKFTGTVARTAQALDSTSRTLLVEVQVDNSSGELLPGMYSQVKFSIPRSSPVIVIPADALVANAQGTRVAVVDGNRRVHFRAVQVGRDFGAEVEVLSGLNGEDAVASNPPDTLVEGQEVAVQHAEGGKKQ
jgi:RND family efflux transporter MFP subunit